MTGCPRLDLLARIVDRGPIGHVEHQRTDPRVLGGESIERGRPSRRSKYHVAGVGQSRGGGPAYPG
jgi:hypothetical protein